MGLDHAITRTRPRREDVVLMRKEYEVDNWFRMFVPRYWEEGAVTIDELNNLHEYLTRQVFSLEVTMKALKEVIEDHEEGDRYGYWRSD